MLHKVAALQRMISVHLSHMINLTEDSSVKSVDRQKIKGYVLQWQDAKVLLG